MRQEKIILLSTAAIAILFFLGGLYLVQVLSNLDPYNIKSLSVDKYVNCFENYVKYHSITHESDSPKSIAFKCNNMLYKSIVGQMTLFLFGFPIILIGFIKNFFDTTDKIMEIHKNDRIRIIHKSVEVGCYIVVGFLFLVALYGGYIWLDTNSAVNIGKAIGSIGLLLDLAVSLIICGIAYVTFVTLRYRPTPITATTGTP